MFYCKNKTKKNRKNKENLQIKSHLLSLSFSFSSPKKKPKDLQTKLMNNVKITSVDSSLPLVNGKEALFYSLFVVTVTNHCCNGASKEMLNEYPFCFY